MMITDFSFCSGVASLGSDCILSWSLWMFRWFWIVNHQNCCSNNSSFMAGRVKHLCQEWSITIWLVLIKFWQVPWNVRLREWPIIGNGEAICVQVNTTWLIVTMCCHGYKISAFEHFHVNSRFRLSTDGSGLGKRFSRYADDQSVPWRLIYACFKLQFAHKSKGLAAQSKAEAIGWNKISSANQRPGFQMIFYTCQSARHMIMQLWFAV